MKKGVLELIRFFQSWVEMYIRSIKKKSKLLDTDNINISIKIHTNHRNV